MKLRKKRECKKERDEKGVTLMFQGVIVAATKVCALEGLKSRISLK